MRIIFLVFGELHYIALSFIFFFFFEVLSSFFLNFLQLTKRNNYQKQRGHKQLKWVSNKVRVLPVLPTKHFKAVYNLNPCKDDKIIIITNNNEK